ncbi:hypothetical protein OIV83_004241 [Microbotryomycetes sp. JL201]|nr:hypothetical protein OIV83_004241 [Microbotryomycetes sp. JL201]
MPTQALGTRGLSSRHIWIVLGATLVVGVLIASGGTPTHVANTLRDNVQSFGVSFEQSAAAKQLQSDNRQQFDNVCGPLYAGQPYHIHRWSRGNYSTQNFGDEIGPDLVERILGGQRVLRGPEHPRLLTIGSYAHFAARCTILWGTGSRSHPYPPPTEIVQVRATRGPLTRKAIMQRYPNLYVPEIYGDPALLVPKFFPEIERPDDVPDDLMGRVVVLLHMGDLGSNDDVVEKLPSDWRIVSALAADWRDVVREIRNSTFVISSSMHGLILADAYGVPSRGVMLRHFEPEFKFHDYYEGTGRPNYRRANSISEAVFLGPEDPLQWDYRPLLDAFPRELFAN